MKVIIDIDDNTFRNIEGYCKTHNVEIGSLITNLFNKYIQVPANVIDDLYAKQGNLNELNEFRRLLTKYLNDAIYDIEESAKSNEAYDTDKVMAKVFKVLNRDLADNAYILTTLFQAYQDKK